MSEDGAENGATIFDLTLDERARYSLFCVMRFDRDAVAAALRAGSLNRIAIESLAKLIEGSHPTGIRLAVKGQGKGWKPIYDRAKSYDRLMAIGRFIDARVSERCSLEDAVIDATEAFGLAEATIYRDLKLYRRATNVDE